MTQANQGSAGKFPMVEVPSAIPEKVYSTERVGISRKTHNEHLTLWQGYAKKTNEIRELLGNKLGQVDPSKANQVYSEYRGIKVDYSFAYEGYINHNIYFETLGGDGKGPSGDIERHLIKCFGSVANWEQDWIATGMAGRGWAFLAYDHREDRLFNYIGDAQNTYPIWDHCCILAMDVYEHAYVIDFGVARAKYIDAYMKVIDWDAVNKSLLEITKLRA